MNVIHALGWYFPESSGGTEVYVESLARNLAALGVHSRIAAATDDHPREYQWEGVGVYRYPVPASTREDITVARTPVRFDEFEAWLRAQDAEVYHQHSWTRGCGPAHLRLAKSLGLKTIVTAHVPSVVCLRGTMMLDGAGPCDGMVDVARCTRCWGTSRSIPPAIAAWEARYPDASETFGRLLPDSRARTALLTPVFVERRQADLVELGQTADKVVAVCRWLYDALALNGLPREKLVYCAQGIETPAAAPAPPQCRADHRPLRVGFLGRWERVKGIHVLVEAFRKVAGDVPAELVIHGLTSDLAYEGEVRAMAQGDARIRIEAPVGRADLASTLAGFDVLAVPSIWMETGPLVVLEAFAAGIPVIGSRLGGISELVEPGVSGILVPAGNVQAWTRALEDLASTASLNRFGRIPAPRSSRQVAEEMAGLYR